MTKRNQESGSNPQSDDTEGLGAGQDPQSSFLNDESGSQSRSQDGSSGSAADTLRQATDAFQEQAEQLRALGSEWTGSLRNSVREHPMTAVLTAAAVGVLVARLTR